MSYEEERELLNLTRENNGLLKQLIQMIPNNNNYTDELAINVIANLLVRR